MRATLIQSRAPAAAASLLSLLLWGPHATALALVDAVRDNDRQAAVALLDDGAAVNVPQPDGTTALHWAVYHDDADLVARLIAAGADANARNEYGSMPLTEAAVVGNSRVVAALLEAGADPQSANADGETALMLLAREGNVEAASLLVEAGADVNARELWREQTALMWAAAQSQPAMVDFLLEHGADPNVRSTVNDWSRQVSAEPRRMYRPTGGLTPLILAARHGCADCARALVAGGADPDLSDPKGVTPLFVAIDNFHFDTAKVLIEADANPNKWDWWGRTPLYGAVDMNSIPAGGRPDRRSTDTTTSLELIEMLLDAGANPNVQLKLSAPYRSIVDDRGCDSMLTTGMTPLLRAAKTFDVEAMKPLIEHGARLDLPNTAGIAPIMAAAGLGSSECDPRGYGPGIPHYQTADVQDASIAALAVLLDAGADVNAQARELPGGGGGGRRGSREGQTALFGAASWGWAEVVRYLAERGAGVGIADAEGRTALDAALGRAGGRGRGASTDIDEETVEVLSSLCAAEPGCDSTGQAQ